MRPPGPASVSPDRRYVVWTSDRGQFHIWRMDIDEGNSGQITRGVKHFFSIPDGNLAYRVWAAGLADSLWKAFDAAPVEVTAVANQELYSN